MARRPLDYYRAQFPVRPPRFFPAHSAPEPTATDTTATTDEFVLTEDGEPFLTEDGLRFDIE